MGFKAVVLEFNIKLFVFCKQSLFTILLIEQLNSNCYIKERYVNFYSVFLCFLSTDDSRVHFTQSIVAAIGVKPWRVTQPTYIQLFDWQNGCGGSS